MQLRNSVSTLLIAYYKLSNPSLCTWTEVEHLSHGLNVSTVGCLSYAMDSTKLDLSYVVRKMYTLNPSIHCDAVKWILPIL